MSCRLPPVVPRLSVLSRTTRSMFPSRPCRFSASSFAVQPTFPSRPYRIPASSRAPQPDVVVPPVTCSRFVALYSPDFPVCPSGFRCFGSYSLGVSSRPSCLPFCPVFRLLLSPFFLSFHYCSFFLSTTVLHTTLIFGGWIGKTVILGLDLTHFCCACVCTFVIVSNSFVSCFDKIMAKLQDKFNKIYSARA